MNGQQVVTFLSETAHRLQLRFAPIARRMDWSLVRTSGLVLALSFVIASSVSTFAANFALNLVGIRSKKAADSGQGRAGMGGVMLSMGHDVASVGASVNKSILVRNLFNSAGILPPEQENNVGQIAKNDKIDFSSVPCTVGEKLPVDLLGTIFDAQSPAKNVIVVKDPKQSESDLYKQGDLIIDHEDFEIYRITRETLEVRKGDQKLCVSLQGKDAAGPTAGGTPGALVASVENTEAVTLDSNYMSEQFKNGGQPILDSAKLIPEIEPGGKTAGFKLIGIRPGSIFEKLKFQNGDIIAEVNGVSLRDPSKGYELYRALQEEREINIGAVRSGEPMSRKVQVK